MEFIILAGDKLRCFFMLLCNMFLGSAHLALDYCLKLAATVFTLVWVFLSQAAFILLVDPSCGETRLQYS